MAKKPLIWSRTKAVEEYLKLRKSMPGAELILRPLVPPESVREARRLLEAALKRAEGALELFEGMLADKRPATMDREKFRIVRSDLGALRSRGEFARAAVREALAALDELRNDEGFLTSIRFGQAWAIHEAATESLQLCWERSFFGADGLRARRIGEGQVAAGEKPGEEEELRIRERRDAVDRMWPEVNGAHPHASLASKVRRILKRLEGEENVEVKSQTVTEDLIALGHHVRQERRRTTSER